MHRKGIVNAADPSVRKNNINGALPRTLLKVLFRGKAPLESLKSFLREMAFKDSIMLKFLEFQEPFLKKVLGGV